MNSNFSFPRQQPPIARPRPTNGPSAFPSAPVDPENRGSNALRASVLDAALQLGFGNNSAVANWMFNSHVDEQDEEEQPSPGLTFHSSAASEESTSSIPYPHTPSSSSHSSHAQAYGTRAVKQPKLDQNNADRIMTNVNEITFPVQLASPSAPAPTSNGRAKLKKKRTDGYESDGGYVSEAAGKKKREKERAKEEKLQDRMEKEEERKRKKSFMSAMKTSKKNEEKGSEVHAAGYETDGARPKAKPKKAKSKLPLADVDNETDAGYLSSTPIKSKPKSRFFRLGTKSKPDLREEQIPLSPIEKEFVPLPIASRFATTLGTSVNSNSSIDGNRIPPSSSSPPTLAFTTPSSPTSKEPHFRVTRDSSGSGESVVSGDSNSKQAMSHISAHDSGTHHRGGSGSYSTITSTSQTQTHPSQSQHMPPQSPPSPPTITPPTSKILTISLPITRSPSISPAASSFSHRQQSPASPRRHAPSPILLSPYSPTQSSSRLPSPSRPVPTSSYLQPLSTLSHGHMTSSGPPSPRRIRFQTTDGLRPPPPPTISIMTTSSRSPSPSLITNRNPHFIDQVASPSSPSRRAPSPSELTVVPSSDYIVPSPSLRNTPLPAPSVLAYYDIPPPSPPPVGPLPSVPDAPPSSGEHVSSPLRAVAGRSPGTVPMSAARQAQTHSRLSIVHQPSPSIQRGRESPFPARPILAGAGGTERVRQHRDLHGGSPPNAPRWDQGADTSREREQHEKKETTKFVDDSEREELVEDKWGRVSEDDDGIRDVLDRFKEAREGAVRRAAVFESETPVERNKSFEQLRGSMHEREEDEDEDDDTDPHPDEDKTVGGQIYRRYGPNDDDDDEDADFGGRNRWSGSIYSRTSFLDPDKSEEARDRFVQRVEAMFSESGREKALLGNSRGGGRGRDDYIPPVPKMPEWLTGAGATPSGRSAIPVQNWNRF